MNPYRSRCCHDVPTESNAAMNGLLISKQQEYAAKSMWYAYSTTGTQHKGGSLFQLLLLSKQKISPWRGYAILMITRYEGTSTVQRLVV